MIQETCKFCQSPYQIDDSAKGMEIQCPGCGKTIVAGESSKAGGVVWANKYQQKKLKPGYTAILTWIYTVLAAVLCTVITGFLLGFISVKFKMMPNWMLVYIPILPGTLAAASIFSVEGSKDCPKNMPGWIMALGLALAFLLSAGPAFLMENMRQSKVRKRLVATLTNELAPPSFVMSGNMSLMAINISKPAKGGICNAQAIYSNNRTYDLSFRRNVSTIENIEGLLEMKSRIIMQDYIPKLKSSLARYPALQGRNVESFKITRTSKAGTYHGTTTLDGDFTLDIIVTAGKSSLDFALADTSKRAVLAIPRFVELWKEFNPGSDIKCTKVVVNEQKDESTWHATAYLSNDQQMPFVLKETRSPDSGLSIDIFLPLKETAIMRINSIIRETNMFGRHKITEQCVNLEPKTGNNEIRKDQKMMKAIFVEAAPLDVLVQETGEGVRIYPGSWKVFSSSAYNRPQEGWSMLIPENYRAGFDANDKNRRVANCRESDDSLSLNTKSFSAVAKFSLSDYVTKEKTFWSGKYPNANVTELRNFTTASGLVGQTYSATYDQAFRAKYFFKKDNSMAIITYNDPTSAEDTLNIADSYAKTLRYNDNPNEETGM